MELRLYVKCKLTVSNMMNCVNKKFGVKVRYQDVYNMVRNIKRINGEDKNIKEQESEYEQLIDMLEGYNQKGKEKLGNTVTSTNQTNTENTEDIDQEEYLQYEIQMDEESAKLPTAHLKLEHIQNMFLQFTPMKRNYHRYSELLFVDATIKHNQSKLVQWSQDGQFYGVELGATLRDQQRRQKCAVRLWFSQGIRLEKYLMGAQAIHQVQQALAERKDIPSDCDQSV
ncbi:UNKNOWN [Stylonychia lemnae]|uniref:Uncharacterized protein n=1 Tax=Stylonychia lemnae TaxID=5949 RepID=A0A077ZWM0_STYLE|nr:UNKNOWN [Stylonychia lemnae]|eukprot:CDW72871.1 UNKNOWN [Stylonychia lemnae]